MICLELVWNTHSHSNVPNLSAKERKEFNTTTWYCPLFWSIQHTVQKPSPLWAPKLIRDDKLEGLLRLLALSFFNKYFKEKISAWRSSCAFWLYYFYIYILLTDCETKNRSNFLRNKSTFIILQISTKTILAVKNPKAPTWKDKT